MTISYAVSACTGTPNIDIQPVSLRVGRWELFTVSLEIVNYALRTEALNFPITVAWLPTY